MRLLFFSAGLDEYYNSLKSLVETAVNQTGKKAFLLGYSYGNQILLNFINNKTSKVMLKNVLFVLFFSKFNKKQSKLRYFSVLTFQTHHKCYRFQFKLKREKIIILKNIDAPCYQSLAAAIIFCFF